MNTEDNIKLSKSNFISSKTTPISKEYTLGKTLGSGAFGTVRLAVHKATKQTRAVKVLKKIKTGHEPPSKRSRNPIITEPP